MTFTIPDEFQQYEKKIYDQRQLIEISRALNSTLDYHYLINAILDVCLAQVQTLQAALFLTPDLDAESLLLVGDHKGFDLERAEAEYIIPLDSPLVGFFEEKNRALEASEIEALIGAPPVVEMLREMGAELIVPMRAKGKIIGAIILGGKAVGGSYLESEKSFLVDLASLGGIAVDNARLYERATVDIMTGLKNHAYLQSRLREERDRAIRRQSPLAFLLTDIDHFKAFNDQYGHQTGDEVLRSVARMLQAQARPVDIAARYGGEEFCLILPGLDAMGAMSVAEAFRQSVEQMPIVHEGKPLQVTVSAGLSMFNPESDARSSKNLIERADRALYACKRSGRNCIKVYEAGIGEE